MNPHFDVTILGEPASAKNQRRIIPGPRPRLIKSKKALEYEKTFKEQCPVYEDLLSCDVSVRMDIWYASRRPDLAAMDLVSDLIQERLVANDRQIKASMSVWNLDKDLPRVRIRVTPMPEDGCTVNTKRYSLTDMFPEHTPGGLIFHDGE
jgi:Holliday junction resolvase RusA-like endonuclease